MSKNTSISLGEHFERFIRRQVKGGRYGTASEVVRAGLRMLEEDESRLAALRDALADGDQGPFTEFSVDELVAEARRPRRPSA